MMVFWQHPSPVNILHGGDPATFSTHSGDFVSAFNCMFKPSSKLLFLSVVKNSLSAYSIFCNIQLFCFIRLMDCALIIANQMDKR